MYFANLWKKEIFTLSCSSFYPKVIAYTLEILQLVDLTLSPRAKDSSPKALNAMLNGNTIKSGHINILSLHDHGDESMAC